MKCSSSGMLSSSGSSNRPMRAWSRGALETKTKRWWSFNSATKVDSRYRPTYCSSHYRPAPTTNSWTPELLTRVLCTPCPSSPDTRSGSSLCRPHRFSFQLFQKPSEFQEWWFFPTPYRTSCERATKRRKKLEAENPPLQVGSITKAYEMLFCQKIHPPPG